MANPNAHLNSKWEPGVSGNPLGRPPKPFPTYIKTAQDAAMEVIQMFVKCMREADDWDTRLRAGNHILDRAFGKPLQQTDITASGDMSVVVRMVLGAQQQPVIEIASNNELPDAND